MAVQGIVFDLDGTLLDTLDDIANCMNDALQENDLPQHPVNAYRYMVGKGVLNLATRAAPPGTAPAQAALLASAFNQEYEGRWMQHTRPYDGINFLLSELRKMQLHIGVLSNKPHSFTARMVDWYFPQGIFSPVAGSQPGEAPDKPNPASALNIAAGWGLPPQDILFVGDSDVDMQTASNAGMRAAGVLWGFRDMEELLDNGAEYLLEKPADLLLHL